MTVFYQTSFWVLIAALSTCAGFFYKMFVSKLDLQFKVLRNEIEKDVLKQIDSKIECLVKEVDSLRDELTSFKRHENRNLQDTNELIRILIRKIDIHTKDDPEFLIKLLKRDE